MDRSQLPGTRRDQSALSKNLVALAHWLEGMVESGQVKDYRELARLAQVSTARVAQIIVLAQLAPRIQEYVLFLSARSP